ncbi:putative alpha catenin [Schistosoma mansoni]|uniref:putative alpha catenin n=1 Tax=Schistosoma mansoni TaxID=6183 RepID=UPI0001A62FC5|nr:putative alpha catenin [Schistosoma mansoni]|eukprot:XP_018652236.1 putative alpha catenin [Schistosoma mansoni]
MESVNFKPLYGTETRTKAVECILEPLFTKVKCFARRGHMKGSYRLKSKPQDDILSSVKEVIQLLSNDFSVVQSVPSLSSDFLTAKTDVLDTGQYFCSSVSSFFSDPANESYQSGVCRAINAFLAALSRLLILADIADSLVLNQHFEVVLSGITEFQSVSSQTELNRLWNTFYPHVLQLISLSKKRASDLIDLEDRRKIESASYVLRNNTPLLHTSCKNSLFTNPDQKSTVHIQEHIQSSLKRLLSSVYKLVDSSKLNSKRRSAIDEYCTQLKSITSELISEYSKKIIDTRETEKIIQKLLKIINSLKQLLIRCTIDSTSNAFMAKETCLMALNDATKFGCDQRIDAACQLFQKRSVSMISSAYQLCLLSTDEECCSQIQLACQQIEQLVPQLINIAYLLFKYPSSKSVESNYEAFRKVYEESVNLLYSCVNELIGMHDFLAVSDDLMLLEYQKSIRALSDKDELSVQQTSTSMQQRSAYICEVILNKMIARTENNEYVDQVMEKVTLIRDQYTPDFVNIARNTLSRLAAGQSIDEKAYRYSGHALCNGVHDLRLTALNECDLPFNNDIESLNLQDNHGSVDNLQPSSSSLPRLPSPPPPQDNYYHRHRDQYSNDNEQIEVSVGSMKDKQKLIKEVDRVNSMLENNSTSNYNYKSHSFKQSTGDIPASQENQLSERNEVFSVLTSPQRETMAEELAGFLAEKKRFMREIVKWDDSANDIIVLAKKMCVIMMEMTDFIRGKGPLQSTLDVIEAAQEISEHGKRLNSLCRHIADMCPDSASRRDLSAYLQRVTFYCHQLSITSRVKAGVHMLSDEIFESATSLIQAAKNLMTSVVLTVKESYIASTKYRSSSNQRCIVQWQMRTPEKKSLVSDYLKNRSISNRDYLFDELNSHHPDALNELSQFKHPPNS